MRFGAARVLLLFVVGIASCRAAPTSTGTTSTPVPPPPTASRADAAAEASRPRADLSHVIVTGQSLAIGTMGIPPLTKEQPYDNVMFDTGVMIGEDTPKKLVPLVEGDLIPGRVYRVETLASGFANLVALQAGADRHPILISIHGLGATTYAGLKKGTSTYTSALTTVKTARDLARQQNKSFAVPAVVNVHGESDHVDRTARYAANMLEWQADYERDVKELTGQSEPIPMFETQVSSWTRYGDATSRIPHDQLAAHTKAPGKVILVGPKYHLPYGGDGIHLSAEGYRHLGEDYAKAYRRVVDEGRVWEPVRPRDVSRSGTTITIRFHVPATPLVFDTTLVTNPGDYGFSYVDDEPSAPKISSIALTTADTITITLSASIDGRKGARVRYAFAGRPQANAGPTGGARGNLRDSDATASRHGYSLYNWCVHFEAPVP